MFLCPKRASLFSKKFSNKPVSIDKVKRREKRKTENIYGLIEYMTKVYEMDINDIQ